jgi:gluconate kinase
MPASLLRSQEETLEPPGPEENAITIDVTGSPQDEAAEIIDRLQLIPASAG